MNRSDLVVALSNPNVEPFLHVIRNGETSQDENAYSTIYGGGQFQSFADHPRQRIPLPGGSYTTAAGAYQITESTWNGLVRQYGFEDFSPENQDLAAIALIAGRRALDEVKAGNVAAAVAKLAKEWTSLAIPKRQQEAQAVFEHFGGSTVEPLLDTPAPLILNPIATPQVKPMGIFAALLPTIIQLIPQLASVFKPGSEVAQRNVAAATIVTQAISDATQAVNLQDAVEKMQSDPAALAAAQKAINDVWPSLTDSGPAVTEARKAASSLDQTPPWKNPAVWVTFLFVPLIYGAAWAVLYRDGASDDLKTMVVTAIFAGLLGSITGFFLGSSLGSQRKDALNAK